MVGLSRGNQMTGRDAVSLAEMMVKRAAGLHHNFGDGGSAAPASTDFPALQGQDSMHFHFSGTFSYNICLDLRRKVV